MSDVETFDKYVKAMENFLKLYEDARQSNEMKYEDCGGKYDTITEMLSYFWLVSNVYLTIEINVLYLCI